MSRRVSPHDEAMGVKRTGNRRGNGHDRRVLPSSLPERAASQNGHGSHQRPTADTQAATSTDTAFTATDEVRVTAEADRLAALVRELTAENRQVAAVAAVWQERARVLGDHSLWLDRSSPRRPSQPCQE